MESTLTCPACRAENATTTCRRCRADLSLLFAVERRRGQWLREAARFIRHGDGYRAWDRLRKARALRPGRDLAPLECLASLMEGDFETALALRGGSGWDE